MRRSSHGSRLPSRDERMGIKIGIVSLGCAKNLADSEVILGCLREGGFEVAEHLDEAQVVIVNTCAFIAEAERESAGTIRRLEELRARGEIRRLVVAGCLPARRGADVAATFPGVDRFILPPDIPHAAEIVRAALSEGQAAPGAVGEAGFLAGRRSPRVRLTPPHYAYVKIGEGCDNRCSYCVIPSIRGAARSRSADSIVGEARRLAAEGVREINLISQDTTAYGNDRPGEEGLPALLTRLARIRGLRWIRLLYGHPARYTDELLRVIAGEPRICRYVDFPLQHASDRVLRMMGRRMTKAQAARRLERVRLLVPGVTVRTTCMVGFPGETEREFEELLGFVREARFEHLGAFAYSREKGTAAARMERQVPARVKRERLHRLMTLQQGIVRESLERMLGRDAEVMVDERLDEGSFPLRGRTAGDAPEVDGSVYLSGNDAAPGEIVTVRITGMMEYDLVGAVRCKR